jgi:uncharacterized Zn finger protein
VSYYDWYPKPNQPKKTDRGMRAKSRRGSFVDTWWATRWIDALEQLMDPGRLRRGRRYARAGQVLSITEKRGSIEAKVQGSRAKPYNVTIALEALTAAEWDKVLDILAKRAIFAAQLLSGEMPPDIEEAFDAAGVNLFPVAEDELIIDCTCPDWAEVCKHVAAVHYLLGEQFDENPWLLFRLRGRSEGQIMAGLRSRQGAEADTAAAEMSQAPPLQECLDHFWQTTEPLALSFAIEPPLVSLSVLRRLGQPGFLKDDLESLLRASYQNVTQATIGAWLGQEMGGDEP